MMAPNQSPKRLSFLAAAVLLGGALSTGCVSVVPYQPNEGLVTSLGQEAAKSKLAEILRRATIPAVSAVNVTDDYVEYHWQQMVPGPFWAPMAAGNAVTQISYANIGRIQIHENHHIFIWGPGDNRRDEIRFATADDAREFSDLLMSFRAARAKT